MSKGLTRVRMLWYLLGTPESGTIDQFTLRSLMSFSSVAAACVLVTIQTPVH